MAGAIPLLGSIERNPGNMQGGEFDHSLCQATGYQLSLLSRNGRRIGGLAIPFEDLLGRKRLGLGGRNLGIKLAGAPAE
jgi:hypothetical protein